MPLLYIDKVGIDLMGIRFFALALAFFMTLSPTIASAQIIANVIANSMDGALSNLSDAQCFGNSGNVPEAIASEAELSAKEAVMQYWSIVSGNKSVMVDSIFSKRGNPKWVNKSSEFAVKSTVISDPFAEDVGNYLIEDPIVFVRSGLGNAARGVWVVRGSGNKLIGYYVVDFTHSSSWQLQKVELLYPEVEVPVVSSFCSTPGDVESYYEDAKNIPENKIAKTTGKAVAVASCVTVVDCLEKWNRAKRWLMENRVFAIVRDTDALLVTAGPVRSMLPMAYAVVLDPSTADGRRIIRFRAWCGNMFMCAPSPDKAKADFLAAIQ